MNESLLEKSKPFVPIAVTPVDPWDDIDDEPKEKVKLCRIEDPDCLACQ